MTVDSQGPTMAVPRPYHSLTTRPLRSKATTTCRLTTAAAVSSFRWVGNLGGSSIPNLATRRHARRLIFAVMTKRKRS